MRYLMTVLLCFLGLLSSSVFAQEREDHPERKIHHLRQAAENLDAAGLHQEADGLREQAEEIERHWHEAQERRGRAHPEAEIHQAVIHELHALRKSVEQLRQEVKELRQQLSRSRQKSLTPEKVFEGGGVFRFIPSPDGSHSFKRVPNAWELNMPPSRPPVPVDPVPTLRSDTPDLLEPLPLEQPRKRKEKK